MFSPAQRMQKRRRTASRNLAIGVRNRQTVGIGSNLTGSREFRPVDVQYGLRGTVNAEEIQQVIRASIDKLVSVAYTDGTTQKLFVHTVDDEGFVCDLVTELRQPPAYAFWVRFTDVLEVHPIQNASDNK